ncbi:MAG: secretin N-terminal domain-containing protein, partial [Janthinobacterium lividum]
MKSSRSLMLLFALGILAAAADGDVPPPLTPTPAAAPPVVLTPAPVVVVVPSSLPVVKPAPKAAAKKVIKSVKPPRKPAPKKVAKKPAKPVVIPPPWATFDLNPSVKVKLDFRNASVDAVIHVLSQTSGISIIKDPSLVGGVTLQSPKPQSLNDAFAMFDAILHLKNYEMTKDGNFLLVAPRVAVVAGSPPGGPGGVSPIPGGPAMPGQPGGMPPGMGQPGGPHMMGHPGGPPSPSAPPSTEPALKVYLIHYASATEVARVITDVFGAGSPPPQPNFFPQPGPPTPTPGKPVIKASAEDYSNTVIVYAPPAQQTDIAAFIAQIDKPSDEPQEPRVFKLQYSLAEDLEPVIQGVLNDSASLGRGVTTTAKQQQDRNRQQVYFFDQSSNSDNQSGSVIADARTNSLVVTATKDNLDHIAVILKELDQPAIFQSTTWVYSFKNARADVVANLLNQSFGNKTTNGPVGGSLTNTGLNQSSGSQVGQTSGESGGGTSQPPSLQTNSGQQNNNSNNPRQ